LPPGAVADAAAVCTGFGFRALRANPGANSSRSDKAANVSDESANRDDFNCENVDREKLDLGFMEYVVFLSSRQCGAFADISKNCGPLQQGPNRLAGNDL
jgi:hypothetical protein